MWDDLYSSTPSNRRKTGIGFLDSLLGSGDTFDWDGGMDWGYGSSSQNANLSDLISGSSILDVNWSLPTEDVSGWTFDLSDILGDSSGSLGLLPYQDTEEDYLNTLRNVGMTDDDILGMDMVQDWRDAVYNTVSDQLKHGLITEDQANNIYQGRTSDDRVYGFSSPTQDKALGYQRSLIPTNEEAYKAAQSGNLAKAQELYRKMGLTPAEAARNAMEAYKQATKLLTGEDWLKGGLNAAATALSVAKALKGNEPIKRADPGVARPVSYQHYAARPVKFAEGGRVSGGLSEVTIKLAQAVKGGLIPGGSKGQDDDVDARLSSGEYVFDAESVSMLGDGNTEAGARELDRMRANLRKHKRSAHHGSIAPKAKPMEKYREK